MVFQREEGEKPKKGIVYAGIVIGILLACCGIYWYLFVYVDVDYYLNDQKGTINLYDFYEKKVGEKETAVYFIGSSIVGRAVYPPIINEMLNERGYDIQTYNLYFTGDLPIERALEIQKIIDSKPSLVIYGVTYRSVHSGIDRARFEERTKLVNSIFNIRLDSLYLYTDTEIREYIYSLPTLTYYKTFVDNAKKYKGKGKTSMTWDYSVDPYGINSRQAEKKSSKNMDNIIKESKKVGTWNPKITAEPNRYKEALLYNVRTLQNAGIPVVLINMPLHPLISATITDESRDNFYDLLNQTGSIWYDMEQDYGDEYFSDSHHPWMWEDGCLVFSDRMVDLIIDLEEQDVIHHT